MRPARLAPLAITLFTLAACGSSRDALHSAPPHGYPEVDGARAVEADAAPVAALGDATQAVDRQILREAWATIEVDDVEPAATRVTSMIPADGFVESSQHLDDRVRLVMRIPEDGLDPFLAVLHDVGVVENLSVNGQDVTEQLVDWQARLDNLTALRDRMRQHLDRAATVQELITVERELARLQSEIDSLAGRLAALRGAAALSRVSLELVEEKRLGPIAVLFSGLGKALAWLFVIE
jgi:hypothetical protein